MAEAQWDCFKRQWETGFLSVSLAGPRDILCTCQLKTIYICFSHSSSQRGKWTFLSTEALESVTTQDKAMSVWMNGHSSERNVWCYDLSCYPYHFSCIIWCTIRIDTCQYVSQCGFFFKCVYFSPRWFVAQDLIIFTCSFLKWFLYFHVWQFLDTIFAWFFFTWLLYFILFFKWLFSCDSIIFHVFK